ncbi:hypothetical protein [Compostibacter hankyongensis]|uniref:Uncharacterized protein n=1 Tax=Compostibacter hankyongensis TaxID=1007089 RepID=A0ABP8G6W3_9BACT
MKKRWLLFLLFAGGNSVGLAQQLPALGDQYTEHMQLRDTAMGLMGFGDTYYPAKTISIHNVLFWIGIGKETGKVRYIWTKDPAFTLQGQKVIQRKLSEFKNKGEVKLYGGFSHYLPLDSGWYAAFRFDEINDSSKVLAVFKFDFQGYRY